MAELVTDYLEGALPLHRRLAVNLHLFRCPACTRYFDQMRRTIALLRRIRPPAPPEAVEEAVLRRLADARAGIDQEGHDRGGAAEP
ncbi:MAG: hypothetical protein B7Z80_06595 [Rhodospirillales bacterium 20-64-7]|nr:MAG: hypothetical protein B7Z80_06595 [Rhodospirillales bacterium 20-64-7]HQT75509.1 zf-HC2 domain-containing protein [Rhodopila sp.]